MEAIFDSLKNALASQSIFSFFGALLLAYLGGIISSFTPCIYPMIPITVGFVGGTADRNIKNGWILSSIYVLGMSTIYTIIGIIAAISGRIFGTLTNTPGWYLGLGIVLVLSSLWMMDVIQFDPMVWVEKWSSKFKKTHPHHHHPTQKETLRSKELSAFLLGFSSGFIAAPCTTPVLTTILTFIATEKSIITGGLLMFSFALGLGTILVVIGTFAGALKILPKSGKWMSNVKKISGYMILAIGMYFTYKAGQLK